jgi:hypothetical protein
MKLTMRKTNLKDYTAEAIGCGGDYVFIYWDEVIGINIEKK